MYTHFADSYDIAIGRIKPKKKDILRATRGLLVPGLE